MSARILDGTAVARQIRSELSSRAAAFTRRAGRQPGLSIVLVGDKPDSQIYVNSKLKSAGDEGMKATLSHLPASTSLDEILSLIDTLNADPATDGILVQAPLPESLGPSAMQKVFDAIDPSKDVDGVTPANVGRLVQNRADLIACTPAGIIELLRRSSIDIAGKHAVVIGRSDIVGKPVSMLLLHRHATVTVCHSRTQDLAANCRDRRHPRRCARPARLCPRCVRAPGRDGHRRRHQPGHRCRHRARDFSRRSSAARAVRAQGLGAGGRRASGGRRSGRRHHAGSGRRRSA